MERVRVDRWLWSVRIYRTRSTANAACVAGHVTIDGRPMKPAHKVAIVVPCTDGYRLYNLLADATAVRLNGAVVPDHAVLQVGDEIEVVGVVLRFVTA